MSNLKKRVQQIQQQLAVSTAETIARFKEVRTEFKAGLSALEEKVDQGFTKLESALTMQGERSQEALGELLDLIIAHGEEQDRKTEAALADHEARLKRLEEHQPPAA
ncbi:MAG: hypothetical protein HY319_12605 [Armatimonadetes bacterium]|nr:hypothetical protein [Armatimonadota bacterium]